MFGIDPGSKLVTAGRRATRPASARCSAGPRFPGRTVTVLGFGAPQLADALRAVGRRGRRLHLVRPLPSHRTIPGAGKWWDGAFALPDRAARPTAAYLRHRGDRHRHPGGHHQWTHLKVTLHHLTFDGGTLNGNVEAVYCAALQTTTRAAVPPSSPARPRWNSRAVAPGRLEPGRPGGAGPGRRGMSPGHVGAGARLGRGRLPGAAPGADEGAPRRAPRGAFAVRPGPEHRRLGGGRRRAASRPRLGGARPAVVGAGARWPTPSARWRTTRSGR